MDEKRWNTIAQNYHDEVLSPFCENVKNPLFNELKKIKNKKKKGVAEFGCGLFYLGPFLCAQFKEVYASDFANAMVAKASETAKRFRNVSVHKEDMRKMRHLKRFDVIISVNALLMPKLHEIKECVHNLKNALKPNGMLFLILPSAESWLYYGMLLFEHELKSKAYQHAIKSAKRKADESQYDYFMGHYTEKKDKQKVYYKHEIEYVLKKEGFRNIKFKKVKYPWADHIDYFEDLKSEDPLWDWLIIVKRGD